MSRISLETIARYKAAMMVGVESTPCRQPAQAEQMAQHPCNQGSSLSSLRGHLARQAVMHIPC